MMPEKLLVFVEEPSMEAALGQLLPKMIDATEFEFRCFQCKDDLLKNLPARLRGYKSWMPDTWKILVLLDCDNDDCQVLKQTMETEAQKAGFITKTSTKQGQPFQVVNRIVIEELEAWFFGDWQAVCEAYPKVPKTIPEKARYRTPDAIQGGTWESFERVLKKAGYFKEGLNKLECAKDVARHMCPERNVSNSFQAFRKAVEATLRA